MGRLQKIENFSLEKAEKCLTAMSTPINIVEVPDQVEEDLYSVPETPIQMFEKRFPLAIKYGWYLKLDCEPGPGNNYYIVRPPPNFECSDWAFIGEEKKVKWAGMSIIVPHCFWDDHVMKFGKWKRHPYESKTLEKVTEKVTEKATEKVTEKATEKVTEPVLETEKKDCGVRPLPDFLQKVSPKTSPKSVPAALVVPPDPVETVVVPPIEKQTVRDGFRDEVVKESRIGNMKKLAAEVHITGVSKYTLAKIEELRSLILQRL